MGRLTMDIPDGVHHHLRVQAANHGVTIKDFVLERILPDLGAALQGELTLAEQAKAWEVKRTQFHLGRGERSFGDVIHEDHKW